MWYTGTTDWIKIEQTFYASTYHHITRGTESIIYNPSLTIQFLYSWQRKQKAWTFVSQYLLTWSRSIGWCRKKDDYIVRVQNKIISAMSCPKVHVHKKDIKTYDCDVRTLALGCGVWGVAGVWGVRVQWCGGWGWGGGRTVTLWRIYMMTSHYRCLLIRLTLGRSFRWYQQNVLLSHRILFALSYSVHLYRLDNVSDRMILATQIAKFMGPTWSPLGSSRPQMGPMLAPWPLLSVYI